MEFSAMRVCQGRRPAQIVASAAAILAMSVSAFGQTGQSSLALSLQNAAMQAASEPQDGPVRRLSIDEAVQLAIEQNLGIKVQRVDPQIQDTGISLARSNWAPMFSTTLQRLGASTPATSVFVPTYVNGTTNAGIAVNQSLPWFGGNYTLNWNNQRVTSTNIFSSYSPQLYSNIQFNFSQPLLRNFSMDAIRQQVATSKKVRDLSDINLQTVVTGTLRNVRNAYWDLSYAISNLKAAQDSLALSQQLLKDNQKRVEIGTLAPLDIVQAQAEVASNESGVIVAEANIKLAQDNLRTLILDPSSPDFWTVSFDPTDAPAFAARAIDIEAGVKTALDTRADIRAARNSLEQSDINIKYYANQLKPDVNAQLSYGAISYGGTQLSTSADPFNASSFTRTVVSERGYGSVLGDVLTNAYPQWTVGVQIGYPLGMQTSRANLARVRLEYEQAEAQLKNQQMQVVAQVRAAGRNVQTNEKRVAAARSSRELQEKKLEAEEKKLAAGMSSTFLVFQAQRDLSSARTTEIQAISDYNKSLVDFEAVQQVPINGIGNTVNIAR
jgi:outer membrane protein TolC